MYIMGSKDVEMRISEALQLFTKGGGSDSKAAAAKQLSNVQTHW